MSVNHLDHTEPYTNRLKFILIKTTYREGSTVGVPIEIIFEDFINTDRHYIYLNIRFLTRYLVKSIIVSLLALATATGSSSASTSTSTSTSTTTVTTTLPPLVDPCLNGIYWNVTRKSYLGTGSSGLGLNQLSSPTGIFLDASDNVYVADTGNYRIMKYPANSPSGTNGTVVAGTTGSSNTTLDLFSTGIRYLYVDSSENIYVSDTYNNRVMLWSSGASTGVIVAGNGSYGTALNEIYYPYGIWVDSSSNVFVAEYQNHRVTKWAPGATTGILVAGVTGSSGFTANRLSSPAGLYYDEVNQDLYIANSGNATTVMKWRVGASNGTVVAGVPATSGSTSNLLKSPMGITLDQWNNLYVADRSNSRVQLFCNGNLTGITIAGTGTTISAPYDVKLDSRMNLYVSDNSGSRVSKFSKL